MGLFVKLAHYKVEELVYSIKFGSITLPENHVVETKKLPSFQNSFPVLIWIHEHGAGHASHYEQKRTQMMFCWFLCYSRSITCHGGCHWNGC